METIKSGLYSMKSKLPGKVLDISMGPTFMLDRNQGFTHALCVDFKDKDALTVFTAKFTLTSLVGTKNGSLAHTLHFGMDVLSLGTFVQKGLLTRVLTRRFARQEYAAHPDHVAVITDHMKPNMMGPPLAMDYEF